MHLHIRRGKTGRIPIVALAAAATATVLALSGCSTPGAAPGSTSGASASAGAGGEDINVVYIGSKGTTFENAIFDGLDSVDGIKATFVDIAFDVTKQSQAIDDAVVSGKYQGIVLLPANATGPVPAVERAIAAGIQVVNVASALGPDVTSTAPQVKGVAASIIPSPKVIAEQQWKMGLKYCADKGIAVCNIGRVDGLPQYPNAIIFKQVDEAQAKAAGSKVKHIETVYSGGFDASVGLTAGQDLLTAHPEINVLFAADPNMKGVEQAVANANADVALIGEGGTNYGLGQVRKGVWYGLIAHFPRTEGEMAGDAILRHLADPSLASEEITPKIDGIDTAFTKENIDTYDGQYE
jgi:ribose transport system substrate-binding protein